MSPEPSINKPSGTLTTFDGNGTIIERKQLVYVNGRLIVPGPPEEKKPEETMHPDGRPHIFLRDGTPNPEFKKWQHQHIHFASPEVCEVSGIDDSIPTAIDKLMIKNRDETFRQVGGRLNMLFYVPRNAKIYEEKNGRGLIYYRVRYDLSHPRGQRQQVSIYLGTDPRIAKWAEEILFERFGTKTTDERPKTNTQQIQSLKTVFRRVRKAANEIAKKAGYWFNGYYLVEKHNE